MANDKADPMNLSTRHQCDGPNNNTPFREARYFHPIEVRQAQRHLLLRGLLMLAGWAFTYYNNISVIRPHFGALTKIEWHWINSHELAQVEMGSHSVPYRGCLACYK